MFNSWEILSWTRVLLDKFREQFKLHVWRVRKLVCKWSQRYPLCWVLNALFRSPLCLSYPLRPAAKWALWYKKVEILTVFDFVRLRFAKERQRSTIYLIYHLRFYIWKQTFGAEVCKFRCLYMKYRGKYRKKIHKMILFNLKIEEY